MASATKGGFPRPKGGLPVFPREKPGCKGFIIMAPLPFEGRPPDPFEPSEPFEPFEPSRPKGRVHKAAHHNPHGLKGRVKLSNLRANRRVKPRPEGPSTLTPAGRVNRVNKKTAIRPFLYFIPYMESPFFLVSSTTVSTGMPLSLAISSAT